MALQFRANVRARSPLTTKRRGRTLLAAVVLLTATVIYLSYTAGFAAYALTGFSWIHTKGSVTSRRATSDPTIEFTATGGPPISFTEDYYLLCRRSLCWVRTFNPGEIVSVVYDPAKPKRAFVDDWALIAGVISWFGVAGFGILLGLMVCLALIKSPAGVSIQFERRYDLP